MNILLCIREYLDFIRKIISFILHFTLTMIIKVKIDHSIYLLNINVKIVM